MNKTKMILAGTGGAIGLIVLVLAFLVWQAFSAKTAAIEGDDEEGTDGLETVEARAQTLSRKPVYPCAASVSAIAENQKLIDEWRKEGLSLAARGDKVFPKTTPAQFKTDLVADAKRLMDLPGAAQGKLAKPDFAFGPFRNYIAEGKMPAENELAELQRRWDDVVTVTELLVTNGVSELLDVGYAAVKGDQGSGIGDQERKGKARKGVGNNKAKKGVSKGSDPSSLIPDPSSHSYVFTFSARPSAFIRTINALESCERFVTVDTFTFVRPTDVIADAFGGDEKKAEAQSSGRRGRRGRRGGGEQADVTAPRSEGAAGTEKGKNRIVTDPLLDAPLTVTLALTVHDFRSLEDGDTVPDAPRVAGAGQPDAVTAPRSEGTAGTVQKGASK